MVTTAIGDVTYGLPAGNPVAQSSEVVGETGEIAAALLQEELEA